MILANLETFKKQGLKLLKDAVLRVQEAPL